MTEQELHPTKELFGMNALSIAPEQQPNLPQPGYYQGLFAKSVQGGMSPQELGVDIQSEIVIDPLENQRLLNNTIQASQNLQDAPRGMAVKPTEQSDLCFGISSVLGVTKEALGIVDPDRLPPEMSGPAMQNNPMLNADMAFRLRSGMGIF